MEITVKVNDKQIGFKFTNLTMITYCRLRDIDLSDYDDDFTKNVLESNLTLFRAANAVFNKSEPMNEFKMDDIMSNLSQSDYKSIIKCYGESMASMVSNLVGSDESKKK